MQVATGSYLFGQTTRSLYFSNGLGVSASGYDFSVNFPFVVQDSPWISYSGTGGIPTGGPQNGIIGQHGGQGPGHGAEGRGRRNIELADTAVYSQAGFSDPTVNAGYTLYTSPKGRTGLYINGSLKFPLANPARGFGTGSWDFGMGSSITQRLGKWFVMGNLWYWFFGDLPELELYNTWNYGFAITRIFLQDHWRVMVSFTGMTKLIEGVTPPQLAGLGIGHRLGDRTNISAHSYYGMSESAPDWALGMGWQIQLN